MEIEITQEMIDAARADRATVAASAGAGYIASTCQQGDPLCLAIAAAHCREWQDDPEDIEGPWVDADWALLRTGDCGEHERRWTLPPVAIAYYQAWDRGEDVRPIALDIGEAEYREITEDDWYREQGMVQDPETGEWCWPVDLPASKRKDVAGAEDDPGAIPVPIPIVWPVRAVQQPDLPDFPPRVAASLERSLAASGGADASVGT